MSEGPREGIQVKRAIIGGLVRESGKGAKRKGQVEMPRERGRWGCQEKGSSEGAKGKAPGEGGKRKVSGEGGKRKSPGEGPFT
ncbi:hypothetical protein Pmani_036498 [Petrolisthes manimaculis]|uniref:Uncharacterized protein n=1 Tax=Petrolisthes manimaculis TaxID=1843537 RepID=A0AAE1TPC4_9EUCA|nr:hypothetical protein Pmani_036498 [Petrolisthes manimaculis]